MNKTELNLLRLAGLIGTDAKTPVKNFVDYLNSHYIAKEKVLGLKMKNMVIDSREMDNVTMHDRSIQNLVISEINKKVDDLVGDNK